LTSDRCWFTVNLKLRDEKHEIAICLFGVRIHPDTCFTVRRISMPGLFHDFLLLSIAEQPFENSSKFNNAPHAVRVPDDLMSYIWDTLSWIPSYNPAKNEQTCGLCRWGPTIIRADGAAITHRIFTAWAELLSVGPPLLRLTGNWTSVDGEPSNEGSYAQLEFDRDPTVAAFRQLARFAEEVVASNGALYILHQGI
jgi:hypothetical protein